jgi:hypothetical protein
MNSVTEIHDDNCACAASSRLEEICWRDGRWPLEALVSGLDASEINARTDAEHRMPHGVLLYGD